MRFRHRDRAAAVLARSTPSAAPLDETVAFELATKWKEQWCHQVCIRTFPTDDVKSVISSYEAVQFNLSGYVASWRRINKLIAKLHAMAVTWAMISWCPGYGSQENPVFWKKVFDPNNHRVTTDGARFFQFKTFPNLHVQFSTLVSLELVPRVCSALCDPDIGLSVRRVFNSAVRTLSPFVSPERAQKRLPVTLSLGFSRPSDVICIVNALRADQNAKRSSKPPLAGVELSLDALTPKWVDIRTTDDIETIHSLLDDHSIQVDSLYCQIYVNSPLQTMSMLNRMKGPMPSIRDFTLQCDSMVDPAIGAILSLIPFVKTLRTLRLTFINSQDPVPAASDHVWYWLEYALHHPNSATSTCEQLALDFPSATEQDCALLEDALAQRPPERSQVLVQAISVIRRRPATFEQILFIVDKDIWVDVCFWESHDGWISVVVAGVGIGWVLDTSILCVRYRQISNLRLTALKYGNRFVTETLWSTDMSPEVICLLVAAYGSNLRLLNASSSRPATADHVMTVLTAAPALKSLHMCHDGSIWCEDGGLTDCYLSLEELSFEKVAEHNIVPTQSVMICSLANVTALHVESSVIYGAEEMKLMQELLRRNPRLQYLRCSHRLYGQVGNYKSGYPQHREDCRRSFGLGERSVALAKLPRRCRMAFLSVVRHLEKGLCSGVDEDVIQNVFSYASVDVLREVWTDTVPSYARDV